MKIQTPPGTFFPDGVFYILWSVFTAFTEDGFTILRRYFKVLWIASKTALIFYAKVIMNAKQESAIITIIK